MSFDNKIYLDEKGYNQYLEEIEKLKEELKKINAGRKDAYDASAGDGWDCPEFEEIERQSARIISEINRRCEELSRVVIINKHNNESELDIDDVIVVDMIYSKDDIEEFTFRLVGGSGNFKSDIQEVSINSPLGACVYKKKIGDICNYSIENTVITVLIKEKMELENKTEHKKIK